MKTRNNYVSNSSSSSFILMDTDAVSQLSSKDLREALQSLYKNYAKIVAEHREYMLKNGYEDDTEFPFCVFDMRTEREEAVAMLKDILEGWTASNCFIKDGVLQPTKEFVEEQFEDFMRRLEQRVERNYLRHKGICNAYAHFYVHDRDDITDGDATKVYVYYDDGTSSVMPLDKKYADQLLAKWDSMGLCTNADVLENEKARFAFHFDENEYCMLKGMQDEDTKKWETEFYTYGRLCEVLAKWLVAHGKVKDGFTWHDLVDATLTVNMHEG